MIWFYVLLISLGAVSEAADHETFKNCSRIPFCSKLRGYVLEDGEQFRADLANVQIYGDVAHVPLINGNDDRLLLEVSFLIGDKARVKILEGDRVRYELSDVLDREPEKLILKGITPTDNSTDLTLVPNDSSDSKVVIVKGPPFQIEFYNGDELTVILKGDRLIMENGDNSLAFAFAVDFDSSQKLYGLHHHAMDLELQDTNSMDPYRLRNSDTAGYEVGSPMALYGSVPAVYGHSAKKTFGVFLHNAAEQWVDISYEGENPTAYFMVEAGTLDLFVLLGPTTRNVVRQITALTGKAHLPQLWTLGYHQCRYSYMSQEEVKNVVALMNQNEFPMDAIWLDIDYTDGKKYFTWNPETFPDPVEMQQNISATNKRLVTILDPHIKVDEDYPVYAQAKGKYFVRWANGSDFQGVCWPGLSSYIDFLDPEARDYYASWYSYENFNGSTEVLAGVWNDMNEPSVFDDSFEKTFPFELIQYGNIEHRNIHNIYGFTQTKATHQGLMQRDNGTKRPFILTRSHFAGSQRYAAMWTGDNTADWAYLRVSYSECILANLIGHVFCGADIGGFSGDPSEELLQRWYQAAVWLPFFRGHADKGTKNREPYLFSEDVQSVIRNALRQRYRHIPYIYTLFYQHILNGDPIVRPVFYDYPGTYGTEGYILVGSDILARPVMEEGATSVTVAFPGGEDDYWYRADDDSWLVYQGNTSTTIEANITKSPYFYRAGSIIAVRNDEKLSTTDSRGDGYAIYVNGDTEQSAVGYIYVDDYTSFEYLNGSYAYLRMTYDTAKDQIDLELIGGDKDKFEIKVNDVLVRQFVMAKEEGEEEIRITESRVYTETSDGESLADLDLRGSLARDGKVTLKLKR